MKTVKIISTNSNHTAIDLGDLNELMEYSLIHKVNKQTIEGKVYLKYNTHATGTEISFNSLNAKVEINNPKPFWLKWLNDFCVIL